MNTDLIKILRASLYPGNTDEDIQKVIDYCEESGISPTAGFVNIVPVSLRTGEKAGGKWQYKKENIVRPGIGYFRQAALATGQYLGLEPPQLGNMQTLEWEEQREGRDRSMLKEKHTLQYPEYIIMTVRRLVSGHVATFPSTAFWLETYAPIRNFATQPNAMWRKRPLGQLMKCAEAQALRMAFSDRFGSVTSADEIEGKIIGEGEEHAPIQAAGPAPESTQLRENIEKSKQRVDEQQEDPEPPPREEHKTEINVKQIERELGEISGQNAAAKDLLRQLKKRINILADSDRPQAKILNIAWRKKCEALGIIGDSNSNEHH